ncbi:MAG: hypothetical protein ACM37W_11435 [Actinomycetota bacterium]
MAYLKAKVNLKTKGESTDVSPQNLTIALRWSAAVGLDLVAFYKTKDGRVGGIFPENYQRGYLGTLTAFPFMQLINGKSSLALNSPDSEKLLKISQLQELEEVYLCILNSTQIIHKKDRSFLDCNGGLLVTDTEENSAAVPLFSPEKSPVILAARITNIRRTVATLVNENRSLDLATFSQTVPGASLLKLVASNAEIESEIILLKQQLAGTSLLLEETAKKNKKLTGVSLGLAAFLLVLVGSAYKNAVLNYAEVENLTLTQRPGTNRVVFHYTVKTPGRLDFHYGDNVFLVQRNNVSFANKPDRSESVVVEWPLDGKTNVTLRSRWGLLPVWHTEEFDLSSRNRHSEEDY